MLIKGDLSDLKVDTLVAEMAKTCDKVYNYDMCVWSVLGTKLHSTSPLIFAELPN